MKGAVLGRSVEFEAPRGWLSRSHFHVIVCHGVEKNNMSCVGCILGILQEPHNYD